MLLPDRVSPAEFAEPGVVDAEVVGDLVDDGPADLAGDLLLAEADRADRLPVDGDPVGQHPRVLRGAAGERDALVQPEQPGRPGPCSTVTATLRIIWPSSGGSPSTAMTTMSSKRLGSTWITSPLSNATGPDQSPLTQIASPLIAPCAAKSRSTSTPRCRTLRGPGAGGWVLASTRTGAGTAELTVANSGEHIPADQVTGLTTERLDARPG